jgi:hypothetical protein
MVIAPEHAERQRIAPRVDVEERLLLDGIGLNSSDVAEGHPELAASIEAHLADAAPPLWNQTAVSARDTTKLLPLAPPELSRSGVSVQRVRERFIGNAGAA